MVAISGQATMLYKKIDLPKNKDVAMTKECLERILRYIGKYGEYSTNIDRDWNHFLHFDHGHNVMTITYEVWENGEWVDKKKVNVALTCEWKEDIIYGIRKALED